MSRFKKKNKPCMDRNKLCIDPGAEFGALAPNWAQGSRLSLRSTQTSSRVMLFGYLSKIGSISSE